MIMLLKKETIKSTSIEVLNKIGSFTTIAQLTAILEPAGLLHFFPNLAKGFIIKQFVQILQNMLLTAKDVRSVIQLISSKL